MENFPGKATGFGCSFQGVWTQHHHSERCNGILGAPLSPAGHYSWSGSPGKAGFCHSWIEEGAGDCKGVTLITASISFWGGVIEIKQWSACFHLWSLFMSFMHTFLGSIQWNLTVGAGMESRSSWQRKEELPAWMTLTCWLEQELPDGTVCPADLLN